MKKLMIFLMCLMCLSFVSESMAAFAPVSSVTYTDAAPIPPSTYRQKLLTSITVAGNTYNQLITGTTGTGAGFATLQPRVDDLDLNTAIAGFGAAGLQTVNFGGGSIFSTNGTKPDFFFFEAGADPDDVFVAAVLLNGTVGVTVAMPTTINPTGWGNTGLTVSGSVNGGQAITGVSFDIQDLKDASGAFLSANAVIKGLAISPGGSIDPCIFIAAKPDIRGAAHTPVPSSGSTTVDAGLVNSVSWYSPLQDATGAPKADPNLVAVTGYDVWFGTVEPNDLTNNTRVSVNQPGQNYAVTLNSTTTYYWRVDAHVTWNAAGFPAIIKSPVWQFTTLPPTVVMNNVVTLQSLLPAVLSGSVVGTTSPVTSVAFTVQTQDAVYPSGATVTLTNTTVDNKYPTATLATDTVGTYKVKVAIVAGGATVEKIVEVMVFADANACAAMKAVGGWTKNYYDSNSNCIVNLVDFVPLTNAWLSNTGLLAQQTYTGAVNTYVPKAIFDARIEGESISLTDPNAVSDFPATDTLGIRINTGATTASGNQQVLGYVTAGSYAQYTINIPAAGTYDLHLNSSAPAPTTGFGVNVGTVDNSTLYGSVLVEPGTGWNNYLYTVHPGALTFTSAGPTVVRFSFTAARNYDWFTLVKQ